MLVVQNFSMKNVMSLKTPTPRISSKLRAAIDLLVTDGASKTVAAQQVGLSRNGLTKALNRPAVQDLLTETSQRFVAQVESSRALHKARAYEVAMDLMYNAKSEAIRARMAEFLASDGKNANAVNVHVDARHVASGYEYPRPRERVVEIISEDRCNENEPVTQR